MLSEGNTIGVPLIQVPATSASAIGEVWGFLEPHIGPRLSAGTDEA